jgi:hypothetical protein
MLETNKEKFFLYKEFLKKNQQNFLKSVNTFTLDKIA